MQSVARIEEGKHPLLTGFVAGLTTTAVYFVVTEVWFGSLEGPLQVGAGLIFLVGVLLMLPQRTWLRGVGFLVGAAVSLAGVVAIGFLWIVQQTV